MNLFDRRTRGALIGLAASIALVVLASVASAGAPVNTPAPAVPLHPLPLPLKSLAPAAAATARPTLTPYHPSGPCPNLKHVGPGTQVPLSCLPHLPQQTTRNTITPKQNGTRGHLRPMAATGATLDLTAGAGCGSSGALYSVGCSLTWQATNNTDWANSTYQDYQLLANTTTATAVGATYTNNASSAHTTVLSTAGTYAFFVYDTVNQVIVSIVYVNAGAPFSIGVYQDPYHTQQAYQFDAATSAAAYIYLPNVSTTDVYVVYVMSTSVNSYCVFLTPAATPQPGAPSPRPTGAVGNLLCNPTTSVGTTAPSGVLSLQWPLNSTYQAGTYSIVVYNNTTGQTLGQVQVSLTGVSGFSFQLYPTPGANPSPAAYSTPPTTTFAWDSANEQSTAGIVASLANQIGTAPTNGVYRMTITDPDGQVVGIPATNSVPNTCTSLSSNAANCIVTGTFAFANASPALNAPGNYPNNTWTLQLYAPANQEIEASQYFQIKGYSILTQFNTGGAIGQTLNFVTNGCYGGCTILQNVATKMIFTNNANQNFPFAPDPIRGIEFTTGAGSTLATHTFKPPTDGEAGAYGTTFTMAGCSGAYNSATGCSTTVVDSTGGSWTATDYCSIANPTLPTQFDGSICVLQILPNNNNNLSPGASITVPGLTFYAYAGNTGWTQCYATCSVPTSILPSDGLSWSNPNLANSPAFSLAYIGATTNVFPVTAGAFFVGSNTNPGNSSRNAYAAPVATTPPLAPWINTHFYPAQFAQADYQNTTPFQAATGRNDILVVNISGCIAAANPAPNCTAPTLPSGQSQIGAVQITFPPGVNASQITVDPSEPKIPATNTYYVLATSGGNACQQPVPANGICLNPGGTAYNAGGGTLSNGPTGGTGGTAANAQAQIWLDVPASQASYIAQELQVQVYSTYEQDWFPVVPAVTAAETPVVGGGAAGTPVDSLSLQGLSLNSTLMSTQFNPTTVSPGATTTTYSLVFGNTSTAADPNPDPIDAVVIEQTTNKNWTLSAPSITGTGGANWTSTASGTGYNPGGNTMEYWFTLNGCSITPGAANAPPQPPPNPTNPAAAQGQLTGAGVYCTAAQEKNAIAAGGQLTFNFSLADTTTGTKTFYVYAHGANGGGWSNPKIVTVNSTSETAAVQFFSAAQGATDASCSTTSNVPANTVATVAKSPNCFIYEVTNTGTGATPIGTVNISLPAFDINGLSTGAGDWTLVGAPLTQYVVLGTISGGTFKTTGIPAGCTINAGNTSNPVPGSTNGQIQISGCTGFTPGTNIAVEFVANTPAVQSDSYLLPSTIDGATAGLAWTGSDQVTVAFSLGLSLTVDPSNPGPGNSHPTPSCTPAQCAFLGTTLDFGQIPTGNTVTGTDVVRATVVYEGATLVGACPAGAGVSSNTWQLQVSLSAANPGNELFTSVDEANGTSGLVYGNNVNTFFNPTTSTTTLSCGQEHANSNYDTIMNFQAVPGADTNAHIVTVTYTLIGN
jgi:hypothetical protein